MDIKFFDYRTEYSTNIRMDVFVKEQGFSAEIDFDDMDQKAIHAVGFIGEKAVATARFFFLDNMGAYIIGRIAVLKEYRNKGLGRKIVVACEAKIKEKGADKIVIHAQSRAVDFYKSMGYTPFGETELEEGVEHIWVKKNIN